MGAAHYGQKDCVQILLEHGADVHAKTTAPIIIEQSAMTMSPDLGGELMARCLDEQAKRVQSYHCLSGFFEGLIPSSGRDLAACLVSDFEMDQVATNPELILDTAELKRMGAQIAEKWGRNEST